MCQTTTSGPAERGVFPVPVESCRLSAEDISLVSNALHVAGDALTQAVSPGLIGMDASDQAKKKLGRLRQIEAMSHHALSVRVDYESTRPISEAWCCRCHRSSPETQGWRRWNLKGEELFLCFGCAHEVNCTVRVQASDPGSPAEVICRRCRCFGPRVGFFQVMTPSGLCEYVCRRCSVEFPEHHAKGTARAEQGGPTQSEASARMAESARTSPSFARGGVIDTAPRGDSKVPEGQTCLECFSHDGDGHLSTCRISKGYGAYKGGRTSALGPHHHAAPASLGAQLPEILGLIILVDMATMTLARIASNVDGAVRGCIGTCGDSTSPVRKAVADLRVIVRDLEDAVKPAIRERYQVAQVLDAIVDKAQPPKAAVSIVPRPRPLVVLGPGGDFTAEHHG